ncbi:MAG: PQQ-dependent dehydrogenase, methanol/ethanol family [Alphaproteobacteria bacterium]|nr:PQQ-dependent dehydrogenase, methanol/ethanol family [Alphaproteobacteria bacterium]
MNTRILGFAGAVVTAIAFLVAPVRPALRPSQAATEAPAAKSDAAMSEAARLAKSADVDGKDIEDQKPGQWLSYGRTYSEQRFSPLTQINTKNVKQLGVAWQFRTYTVRGLEATPIVNHGIMYFTGSWSKVWALDAKTGKMLWSYDPKVPGRWGRYACCDVVNRGVAIWKGAVYVGTLDGRLVKLDAKTGKPVWIVNTVDRRRAYTITGAPRIVDGLVVIGNGGAEYDTRGYVTAYNAVTGKKVWRFYVVPGDPAKPQPNPALVPALKTWTVKKGMTPWWKMGGGGSPWNAMAYDPKLGLLYVGTGNGDPWNRNIRSPLGGDNLYLSSILALHAKTGKLAWYYQVTPGDTWDFDATADLILADLRIDGRVRHVIMQAPKNGFFFVLDRRTGKLISAKPFALVNWAKGVDPKTGKIIVNPAARYRTKMTVVMPREEGAHNWQPMTYDPQTGLVYIPTADGSAIFMPQQEGKGKGVQRFEFRPRAWNTGNNFAAISKAVLKAIDSGHPPPPPVGYIKAWNPVTQTEVWHQPMTGNWNGGLMSTAGGLVFGGGADGIFAAYDAKTGEKLWSINLKTGILAPPVSYEVDGVQYIALLAGWGGAGGLSDFKNPNSALTKYQTNQGRLFVFKLGGSQHVAAIAPERSPPEEPPPQTADQAMIQKGFNLYSQNCMVCHGFFAQSEGEVPDLRLIPRPIWGQFDNIVLGGELQGAGMASFKDLLTRSDVEAIRAYILSRAHAAWDAHHKGAAASHP